MLDIPIGPVLAHIEQLDVFGFDGILLFLEDRLQEAEPTASKPWHPISHWLITKLISRSEISSLTDVSQVRKDVTFGTNIGKCVNRCCH